MNRSRVQVIKKIYFDREEYSLQYQISDKFNIEKTKKCIGLCEHAIMKGWCGYLNINGKFTGHWLPSGKLTNVTFTGCPIEVVKETAEVVRRIIDAEKIEEVIIDAR